MLALSLEAYVHTFLPDSMIHSKELTMEKMRNIDLRSFSVAIFQGIFCSDILLAIVQRTCELNEGFRGRLAVSPILFGRDHKKRNLVSSSISGSRVSTFRLSTDMTPFPHLVGRSTVYPS